VKFSVDVNGLPGYLKPKKYCQKFELPERAQGGYGRQTDRQTTDGRATANSEREHEFTFAKTMYVQFCNEAKSVVYWLVNETLLYETETFDFQSETRSRPRPSHVSTRPRRLKTTSRDRDYIPASLHKIRLIMVLCT